MISDKIAFDQIHLLTNFSNYYTFLKYKKLLNKGVCSFCWAQQKDQVLRINLLKIAGFTVSIVTDVLECSEAQRVKAPEKY